MAAQFTLTNGAPGTGERLWIKLASKPFPVPLSPWMRIGTPDWATLSIFCRAVCMGAERPKIRLAGGRFPVRSPNPALETAGLAISPVLEQIWGSATHPPLSNAHNEPNKRAESVLNYYCREALVVLYLTIME